MIESENNNLIQSKAKIETERKRLVDREKDLLAKIERDETIFKVMATLKEEKELAEQDAKSVRLKPEEAKKKKSNDLFFALEDAKDDAVESFTKIFDAANDQVRLFN